MIKGIVSSSKYFCRAGLQYVRSIQPRVHGDHLLIRYPLHLHLQEECHFIIELDPWSRQQQKRRFLTSRLNQIQGVAPNELSLIPFFQRYQGAWHLDG
ncbi:hypothetical protein OPV22_025816 [Ensete ventricosum]|uniref:Uncharacterized protein n=1 Tax=Ensete ventricosum TaxID=4639 RepID=A0AAV8QKF0_ENSVE|nr:hypothetical protein OPV22_025816 [Ensete ventricosum]